MGDGFEHHTDVETRLILVARCFHPNEEEALSMLKARYRDGKITAEDGESVEIDDLARRHELAHRRRLRAGIDDDLKILARELRGAPHMVPVGAGSPVINKGLDFIDGDFEPEDGWRALARKICDD